MKIYVVAVLMLMFSAQFLLSISAHNPPTIKWNKTFGGERSEMAYFVQETSDNGFVIAGYTNSFGAGSTDFFLVKTDSSGNMQWNKTYGGTSRDEAYAVQQTKDGGYILAGITMSTGAGMSDFWLVKTDLNGEIEWNKTYGGAYGDIAYSVQQTKDDGYLIAGSTGSFGSGNGDVWLIKTNSEGQLQWSQTYGGLYEDKAYSVQLTNDGGYVVCGYTASSGAGYEDFWLIKTDSNGNEIWNKTYGTENSEYAYFIQQCKDGGYAMAGSTYTLNNYLDAWIVKTDYAGNMQWNKTYSGSLDEEAYAIRQTADLGYIFAGFSDSFGTSRELWVVKTDSTGEVQWNQTIGEEGIDEAYSIQQTKDRGYIVAGTTYPYGGTWNSDFWFIKLYVAKIGDLGGGLPPQFFNYDGSIDGIDLALFIRCYKGMAPPEAQYLGDLGSGLPPQFFSYDGKVDAADLALFIRCYKGLGP